MKFIFEVDKRSIIAGLFRRPNKIVLNKCDFDTAVSKEFSNWRQEFYHNKLFLLISESVYKSSKGIGASLKRIAVASDCTVVLTVVNEKQYEKGCSVRNAPVYLARYVVGV